MPEKALPSLAKKAGVSTQRIEHLWDVAKKSAEKQGRGDDYQYIMGILKKMLKLENSAEVIRPETGMRAMKVHKRVIESKVHELIYAMEAEDGSTVASGTTPFAVKIRYSLSTGSEAGLTQVLSVRASGPEAAKSVALNMAKQMGLENVSVIEVKPLGQQPANTTKWDPARAKTAINPQPGTMAGLVLPTAVHPGLDTSQVLLPGRGK